MLVEPIPATTSDLKFMFCFAEYVATEIDYLAAHGVRDKAGKQACRPTHFMFLMASLKPRKYS